MSCEILQGVKMKGSCEKLKTWVFDNLLLILTFSGVVTGGLQMSNIFSWNEFDDLKSSSK